MGLTGSRCDLCDREPQENEIFYDYNGHHKDIIGTNGERYKIKSNLEEDLTLCSLCVVHQFPIVTQLRMLSYRTN